MNTVRVKSYAKINLTLEITGVEGEYHMLDSLVASVDIFDAITLKKRKDSLSSVMMHGLGSESIPPEKNNALEAAELFSRKYGVNGADITVYKNIPMGAGLGGSSADAAGVLNGMAKLYGIEDDEGLGELADALGSDTKYMLKGGFARMQGRGTRLTKLAIKEKLHFLLIAPTSSVNTGACYRAFDTQENPQRVDGATEKCIAALTAKNINEAGRYLTNDLYAPAAELNPDVKTAYDEAMSFAPIAAFMTGSGSGVLALFETRELCEWAKSRYYGKYQTTVIKTVIPDEIKAWKNPFVIS